MSVRRTSRPPIVYVKVRLWSTTKVIYLESFQVDTCPTFKEKLGHGISKASQTLAVHAINIGQNTFHFFLSLFVMLYLLFFLLRDGEQLYRRLRAAVPLEPEHQRALFDKFIIVIRATLKGTLVVALLQGSLGGLIFWILGIQAPILWGALMSILSLFPAVPSRVPSMVVSGGLARCRRRM